jgi:hypothetical protein
MPQGESTGDRERLFTNGQQHASRAIGPGSGGRDPGVAMARC